MYINIFIYIYIYIYINKKLKNFSLRGFCQPIYTFSKSTKEIIEKGGNMFIVIALYVILLYKKYVIALVYLVITLSTFYNFF